ncbi:Hypothetical predicted protein [Lecanosticta acicola]|uniref:Uncharacterized protein n=1 Tax=Lecanosticta acicola TaxID=111012 RepID=A0AAI8Z5K4_9PEZI|nr:Hypothetical predicted protein [Lecanosticta acicola]
MLGSKHTNCDLAGTSTHQMTFDRAGHNTTISVRIDVRPDEKFSCLRAVDADFWIRDETLIDRHLGYISAYTLDKTTMSVTGSLSWLTELLEFSARQKVPHRFHAALGARIDDTQRIFQLMFDQNGSVREEFESFKADLTGRKIHYVSFFILNDAFIGQGLGPLAMKTYFSALRRLSNGDDLHGTVVLSAAGVSEIWQRLCQSRANTGEHVYAHSQVQNLLINGYRKSKYKLWLKVDATAEGGDMAIMGQVLDPFADISYGPDDDWEMDDDMDSVVREHDVDEELVAMMELDDDHPSIAQHLCNASPERVLLNDSDDSDHDVYPPPTFRSTAVSAQDPSKPDRTVLARLIRCEATYRWRGLRFLVDECIELKWLLGAKESNRALIEALFPHHQLPPPARRSTALTPGVLALRGIVA